VFHIEGADVPNAARRPLASASRDLSGTINSSPGFVGAFSAAGCQEGTGFKGLTPQHNDYHHHDYDGDHMMMTLVMLPVIVPAMMEPRTASLSSPSA
jgi:hypothetical protein